MRLAAFVTYLVRTTGQKLERIATLFQPLIPSLARLEALNCLTHNFHASARDRKPADLESYKTIVSQLARLVEIFANMNVNQVLTGTYSLRPCFATDRSW